MDIIKLPARQATHETAARVPPVSSLGLLHRTGLMPVATNLTHSCRKKKGAASYDAQRCAGDWLRAPSTPPLAQRGR